jgi:DNA invertase Pin-like site-specific DNA recombinase
MTSYVIYKPMTKESKSGANLGLDAQQTTIDNFLKTQPAYQVLEIFEEIETGTNKKVRPQLLKALDLCKSKNATLVIAKLDRLARNVHFVSGLMESKVNFVALDMPEATPFSIHIYAAIAEHEARTISARTKAALAEKKRQGFKLGKPENFTTEHKRLGALAVNRMKAQKADNYAVKLFPTLSFLVNSRNLSSNQAARELNRLNIPTPKGKTGNWCATQVVRCLTRVEKMVVDGQQFNTT